VQYPLKVKVMQT